MLMAGLSADGLGAEFHDEIWDRIVVIMREDAHGWEASEYDAMSALIRNAYQEA